MASANRFADKTSDREVHVDLMTKLCCDYLTVKSYITKFRMKCRAYLTTPRERKLSDPTDILDKLEANGVIGIGEYGKLKDIVRDIDVDMVALIKEAEEMISILREQPDSLRPKRQKTDTESSIVIYSRVQNEKEDIRKFMDKLKKMNNDLTKAITITPLADRGENEIPIELLFAEVIVIENHEYREKGQNFQQNRRELNDPDDLFIKDGEVVRKIYMLGDAAHGKTTYCLWLLKNWCNAIHSDFECGSVNLDKWETALRKFDFVFLLQLRNVNSNSVSVTEMICQDLFGDDRGCHATICNVLSSEKYRSLIIIDGLDEWYPNEETRHKLRCQAIPNIENISSYVTIFFTMRPWVFSFISKHVTVSNRVIQILGLSRSGVEEVIENVLLNRFGLHEDLKKFELKKKEIINYVKENNVQTFMQIPLLAVVCVQILYKGKDIGGSMTSFYAEMLNMLIERAIEKHDLRIDDDRISDCKLPETFSDLESVEKFISPLLKLGKVAFNGLHNYNVSLVFQKSKLEKEMGKEALQFALDVGLISQKEAESLTRKNVSVHFFHKSIQEFLAGIYIVSCEKACESFMGRLFFLDNVMNLSNVIMFVCGLCPSVGSAVSKRFVFAASIDEKLKEYRKSPGNPPISFDFRVNVRELYKQQVRWYKEFKVAQVRQHNSNCSLTFHISDINLTDSSDLETVKLTRQIMSDQHVEILSIRFWRVPNDEERGIPETEVNEFLSNKHNNTKSLVMTYIFDGKYTVVDMWTHSKRNVPQRDLHFND